MILTPQGTDDKDRACLQRIVIRNRLFSKRLQILWKFHPFTLCINDVWIHWLSFLAFGPLHLFFLPPIWLTPYHSTFCSDVPLRKVFPTTLPKIATTLYLAVCFHATHHCLRQSVLHSFPVFSLEDQLREVRDFTLFLAIFLELQCLAYGRFSINIYFLNE